MYVNIIKSYRYVVAICDSEILGKKFEQGNMQLDVKESFYKGEKVDKEKLIEILLDMKKEDATFNIVGEKSIAAALETEIIDENSVGKINGVPYALVLL